MILKRGSHKAYGCLFLAAFQTVSVYLVDGMGQVMQKIFMRGFRVPQFFSILERVEYRVSECYLQYLIWVSLRKVLLGRV